MTKTKLSILLITLFTLVLTNCTKNEEETTTQEVFNFGNASKGAFVGIVVDESNNPVASVSIEMGGMTTTTNSQGEFSLSNVPVSERFAYVKATKNGFVNGSRVVYPHAGINNMKIMLMTKTLTATIASGTTAVVSLPNGTSVKFDGAFVNADGTAYTGAVKVYTNLLAADDENISVKMPGNLIGQRTDGSISGMLSYGMINVELFSSTNTKLQIADNHKATISMVIPNDKLNAAEATIPMWYFNETTGLWVEEGFSTKIGNKYVGDVSHFTLWNNDWVYPVAILNVRALNFDGTPVNGVKIYVSSDVIIEKHSAQLLNVYFGATNVNGTLTEGIPTNQVLTIKAYTPDGQLIKTEVLPASAEMSRSVIFYIPAPNKN